jgi:hypothetical protein
MGKKKPSVQRGCGAAGRPPPARHQGQPSERASDLVHHVDGLSWLTFGLALVREAVLGAFVSCALGLIPLPARIAGEYLGQEMALTLGVLADPNAANPSVVLSQLFDLIASVVFLGLNGHHFVAVQLECRSWPAKAGTPTARPQPDRVADAQQGSAGWPRRSLCRRAPAWPTFPWPSAAS